MLAGFGSYRGMSSVELMRSRDVDDFDGGISAELFYVCVGSRIEVPRKSISRRLVRIGGGAKFDAGMRGGGAHHHRARHAEARNAKAKRRASRHDQAGSPAASLSRSTQTSSPCRMTL